MQRVKQFFRPEFLNRLDEVVLFLPLTNEQLGRILGAAAQEGSAGS